MKTPILILRQAFAITALVALILTLNTGCSSDDDGEVVDIPATVPDVLNYEIRQGTGIFLNLNLIQVGDATVTSTLLTGTFNRITQAFTLNVQPEAMTVSAGDFLSQLDADLGNTDFSNYRLQITTSAAWVGDGDPTSGKFEIFDDEVRKITIDVIADADNTGLPGVQITYWPDGEDTPGTSVSDSFTWEDFDGLFDNQTAKPYARIATFAHSLLRFMYEQGELVILALEFIGENDTLMEQIGTIEESCDTYPLTPSPAPSVIPGMSTVGWKDVNNDTDLGPGDTVYLGFTECWDDDPTDDFDTLYDGGVNLVNFTEVESSGVLIRVGFEPSGSDPGGIQFDYLDITETETTLTNVVIATTETITVNGWFSMVLTSP